GGRKYSQRAGQEVRTEMHHMRSGKHKVKSRKQAVVPIHWAGAQEVPNEIGVGRWHLVVPLASPRPAKKALRCRRKRPHKTGAARFQRTPKRRPFIFLPDLPVPNVSPGSS